MLLAISSPTAYDSRLPTAVAAAIALAATDRAAPVRLEWQQYSL